MSYRTAPAATDGMPTGIPHIIGNEAAERFSFYGMKAVLAVFMANYLHLMDGPDAAPMSEAAAAAYYHWFNVAVYLTPLLGALVADVFLGKFRTIILLSLVYCAGHAALAGMGAFGNSPWWLMIGLALIALGSGGIKPCVSAHVGDQFGPRNARLLERIFDAFYFSINIGAFISMLLTPWLLEWYGPHWAFGVPGVLMAIATLVFWLGRHRFVHIPPSRGRFIREFFTRRTFAILVKILPLYLFVAVFWALFDQTGSTWIFQAQAMDLRFLGITWLPSQLQSLNSVFVLSFIPLFAFVVYPAVGRIVRLTPLRKISVGFFLAWAAFLLVARIQGWIDAGGTPNVGWQVLACALLTAGEVMIAIVSLEFAYTQAPRALKSFVMCYYLGAVALGNVLVAVVNTAIQIPDTATIQLNQAVSRLPPDWQRDPRTVVLPGHDGITGTDDDLVQRLRDGRPVSLEIPGQADFEEAARRVIEQARAQDDILPRDAVSLLAGMRDPWDRPLQYQLLNANRARIVSPGPDGKPNTAWDVGVSIEVSRPIPAPTPSWVDSLRPDRTWLDNHKAQLGIDTPATATGTAETSYQTTAFAGGHTRLHGAAYFHFFAWIMLATALLFIPYALVYRPRTHLHDARESKQ